MNTLYPIILSGGSGTRLWPLSRASYPKQLLALVGQQTMLQATLLRANALPGAQAPLLVCNDEHRFLIREQCNAVQIQPSVIYLEPAGRNTAPAIAMAALHLSLGSGDTAPNPDALMLVLPADHVIDDQAAFAEAVATAIKAASQGYLVTFGITPNSPETGYGYVRSGEGLVDVAGAYSVAEFVEKPDRETASRYLAEGGYTWNSGMFVFTAGRYLEELAAHRPDILAGITAAWMGRRHDPAQLLFCRPASTEFLACSAESIDYAVMQSTTRAAVVPARFGWSDVGSWDSLWQIAAKDDVGNAIHGDVFVSATNNSYIRAESRFVAVIGLDNVVVVETPDSVLVMHRDKAQEIKRAIQHFEQNNRTEHLYHLRVHRPWGWYEGIDKGERFQVKRIMVKPGEKLSLQMHHHRAEHWVVVSGTANVTVDGKEVMLGENQSTYIPVGHTHRLENPGKIPLHLIEVQSGSYLGEDDIVRFEDTYGRHEVKA